MIRLLAILMLLGLAAPALCDETPPPPPKRILMLISYSRETIPEAQIIASLTSQLHGRLPNPPEFDQRELGLYDEQADSQAAMAELRQYLPSIKANQYQLLLVIGKPAISLVTSIAADLPTQLPILYYGIEVNPRSLRELHPNTSGVSAELSLEHCIQLGKEACPNVKHLLLLYAHDSSAGRRLAEEAERLAPKLPSSIDLKLANSSVPSVENLLRQIRHATPDTVIIFHSWDKRQSHPDTTRRLEECLAQSEACVIAMQEPMFTKNTAGGVFPPIEQITAPLADAIYKLVTTPGATLNGIPQRKISAVYRQNHDQVILLRANASRSERQRRNLLLLAAAAATLVTAFLAILAVLLRKQSRLRHADATIDKLRTDAEKNKQILQGILDLAPIGIAVKDASDGFKYLLCNQHFAELVERPRHDILGHTVADLKLDTFPPETIASQDTQAVQTGKTFQGTVTSEKQHLVLQATKKPVYLDGGRRLLICAFDDVTSKINLESSQAQLIIEKSRFIATDEILSHCLTLAVNEPDLAHVATDLLQQLGRRLEADQCGFFAFTPSATEAKCRFTWQHDPNVENHSQRSYSLSELPGLLDLLRQHQVISIDDSETSPEHLQVQTSLARKFGDRSILLAGVWHNQRLTGFLKVDFFRRGSHFTEADLHLLQEVLLIYSLAKGRSQQLYAIEEHAHREKQLFDHARLPMLVLDQECKIQMANQRARELFGPDLRDCSFCDAICAKLDNFQCNHEHCFLQEALRANRSLNRNLSVHRKLLKMSGTPFLNLKGAPVGMLASFTDITDHDDSIRQERIVNLCLGFLLESSDPARCIRRILATFCQNAGAPRGYIMRYDHAASTASIVHEYSLETGDSRLLCLPAARFDEKTPWYSAFNASHDTPVHLHLEASSSNAILGPWQAPIQALSISSACVMPIVIDGRLWGHVGLLFDTKCAQPPRQNATFLLPTLAKILALMQKMAPESIC